MLDHLLGVSFYFLGGVYWPVLLWALAPQGMHRLNSLRTQILCQSCSKLSSPSSCCFSTLVHSLAFPSLGSRLCSHPALCALAHSAFHREARLPHSTCLLLITLRRWFWSLNTQQPSSFMSLALLRNHCYLWSTLPPAPLPLFPGCMNGVNTHLPKNWPGKSIWVRCLEKVSATYYK